MSASFYDLLKYAATGVASPDMTYYDKARASTLMGGAVRTLTGQPPLTFKADGTPLISWSMKGNGQQTGTPTPDNPVMPEFVGVRTGNLADTEKGGVSTTDGSDVAYNSTQSQIRSQYVPCSELTDYIVGATSYPFNSFVAFYDANKSYLSRTAGTPQTQPRIISTPENAAYMRVSLFHAVDEQVYPFDAGVKIMLNLGSTALPHEPYGYKIPISCGGETTPVYLGQTQTVRRIKKLVLTGNEDWLYIASEPLPYFRIRIGIANTVIQNMIISTHLPQEEITTLTTAVGVDIRNIASLNAAFVNIRSPEVGASTDDCKSYLSAQYTAGTPVTVWYVLATPETEIVNEPLCKIGDYADELRSTDAAVTIPTIRGQNTLTVDTELQPSEMTITYKG